MSIESPWTYLRRRRWRRLIERAPITDEEWQSLLDACPIAGGLNPVESDRLRELTILFRHERIFETTAGTFVDEHLKLRISLLACLPILHLDYAWYFGWRTVVIFPGEFVRTRAQMDAAGVMHEWQDVLTGESWEFGPVILSAADVAASGLGEGYNVVIHEMAHKLDMSNGATDGFPPLHAGMDRRRWTAVWSGAFEDLTVRLDRGEEPLIDPYAAESPAEFFAVMAEYFFEQSALLQGEYPLVYDELKRFFLQDPASRLSGMSLPNSAPQSFR